MEINDLTLRKKDGENVCPQEPRMRFIWLIAAENWI